MGNWNFEGKDFKEISEILRRDWFKDYSNDQADTLGICYNFIKRRL